MPKFAKILESEKYGQILVYIGKEDNAPTMNFHACPNGQDMLVCVRGADPEDELAVPNGLAFIRLLNTAMAEEFLEDMIQESGYDMNPNSEKSDEDDKDVVDAELQSMLDAMLADEDTPERVRQAVKSVSALIGALDTKH